MKTLALLALALALPHQQEPLTVTAGTQERLALALPQQQPPLTVTAGTQERGWVDVTVAGPAGAPVRLSEGGTEFATVTAGTKRPRALPWRCEQRSRVIVAETAAPDGTPLRAQTTVRTPSCANRFSLRVSPRTGFRAGRTVRVSVRDTWRSGKTPARACLRVRGKRTCRDVQVPSAVRLRAGRTGVGDLVLSGSGFRVRERLEVRGSRLRVLATGDSMIQILDSLLEDGLGSRASVRSDARISTGISKTLMLDWVAQARRQASRRPQATVMFIGANDGFAIGGAACCDDTWVKAYAARVKRMMGSYRRGGAGRVYWLTLPTPRDNERARIYAAVNRAIKAAAAGFERDEVAVVDLVPIFTPGGRFRSSINGQTVRQGDGIHLNVAGARIAARAVIRRMRADGLI